MGKRISIQYQVVSIKNIQRVVLLFFLYTVYFLLNTSPAHAASLASTSAMLSTSRPSASAPLWVDQSASTTQVPIYSNNSIYLASDSATIRPDTSETINTGTIASQSAQQQLSTNLISYWRLEEATGATRTDSYGTNNMSDHNSVAQITGKVGNGGGFTSTSSQYLSIASNSTFDTSSTSFTFSAWAYINDTGVSRVIVSKGTLNSNSTVQFALYREGGTNKIRFTVGNGSSGSDVGASYPGTGQWFFAVGWYDNVAQTMNVQVNNGTVVSGSNTAGSYFNASQFLIGNDTSSRFWNGNLDEVGYWKRVLTPDERSFLYAAGAGRIYSTSLWNAYYNNVYFTGSISNTHHEGDPVVVLITALHTLRFTTSTPIPSSGKIVLQFPSLASGDANNPASPSASTFQLNNLGDTNVKVFSGSSVVTFTGTYTNPSGTSPPTISLGSLGSSIPAGTTVTVFLGCSAAAATGCTTPVPTIINPTKNNSTQGAADTWRLSITTQDSSSNALDSSTVRLATVEAVQVQGTVDPTLTVTIAGLSNGANFQSSSTACSSEVSNAGIDATASFVNLGVLGSGVINKAGQTITVTTNSANGYSITATSSGRLMNPATGVSITDANLGNGLTNFDTPLPAQFPSSGNAAFGISPCGTRVNPSIWGTTGTIGFGSGAKLSNPWNTGTGAYYATIASYTGGPVSGDITVIRYAATPSSITPAGLYQNYFTYVVTPSF